MDKKEIENNSYNYENNQLNKSEEQPKNINLQEIYDFVLDPYVLSKMWSSGCYLIHIPPNLLNEPNQMSAFDSYYNIFSFNGWHKTPIKDGGWFTPIFHKIQTIKNKFPDDEKILDIISRKTAYLNTSQMEMEYIYKRYNWSEKPEFKEVFLAKFENFTTSLVELIITCINLYEKLKLSRTTYEVNKFESIVDFLINCVKGLPNAGSRINYLSNYLSVYIFIRNSLVHNLDQLEYIDNEQSPLLKINSISFNYRCDKFNDYITNEFETKYTGKKNPELFQEHTNSELPGIKLIFCLTRSSTVNIQKTKIEFEMDVTSLTQKMLGDLFNIQKYLFVDIIAQ